MLQAERSPVRVPNVVDFFNLPNPSSRIIVLGSIQPLTEMSTRNLPGAKKRPTFMADNLAAVYEQTVYRENVGAPTSHNPKGLHALYRDNFTFLHSGHLYLISAHTITSASVRPS
jgi:hypothetical protein